MRLVLYYLQKYYQLLYTRHCEFLLQSLQYETDYRLLAKSLVFLFFVFIIFMLPQIKNSDVGFYRYFKVASNLFIN
jgi:hypothetical protein